MTTGVNVGRKRDFNYVSGKKYDGMMSRCYRPGDTSFKSYGGRGIRVAGVWIKSISAFRDWLEGQIEALGISKEDFIEKSRNYQLDRIDVNGHYSPENCRISSPQENARNQRRRNKVMVESAEGESIEI